MSWEYIKFDKNEHVAKIIFNNPQKNNALNILMRSEFSEVLNACSIDDEIKVVIITTNSENFCSGADLSEFNTFTSIVESNLISKNNNLWKDLYNFEKPIVCLTKGWVIGSGFEIIMLSDFVFSHTSSKFKMPEVELSLTPISGGTQTFLNKTNVAIAKEIMLFSEVIDVYKAYNFGIINFYSDDYNLLIEQVRKFTENIKIIDLKRLKIVKKLLNLSTEENLYLGKHLEQYYSESLR